jgi:signal transduction histidine kinase
VRNSIKLKFSIFFGALLLLTVFVLSMLVLNGIKKNQYEQYEQYLDRQAQTANIYFLQTLLSETNKVPNTFLNTKGKEFTKKLEQLYGQAITLYDSKGNVVSEKVSYMESESIKKTLEYALKDKTAYLVDEESLYYMAPLTIGNEQVGVVQFYYSLSEDISFYNQIRQLFITIGAGVFLLSFLLAYFYFGTFANKIISLEHMVKRIQEGDYKTTILKRRDEIGRLSQGIHAMSGKIKATIEEIKDEKNKLTLAITKLSKVDKQQKEFIGNVTHEFKTPLTSIKAYIDLLEMYPDDDELLETAKTSIKSETIRLYEMVEKVLQLSALEKYDFELNVEKVDIKQSIQSVLNSLSGKINKFGLRLETDLSDAFINADKDILLIIFMNLLDNSIKYNKVNGKILVKNNSNNGEVIIDISDTGIGISKEEATKIFEPFYTVDKNRSRQNGGAGLGLPLAKRYIEMLGGRIVIVNSNTTGTTFRILFPICKD